MTWSEIKKAVEQAGVRDDEEIGFIQCENGKGDRSFHKVRLGKMLKLAKTSPPKRRGKMPFVNEVLRGRCS